MRINRIDYHFSKLRYQPDFENFTDEEFELIKEHTILRSYKKDKFYLMKEMNDNVSTF